MAVPLHTRGTAQQDVSFQILVNYGTLEVPEQYFCKHCGVSGVRLWRRLDSKSSLSCRKCTMRLTGSTPAEQGELKDPVPAIPTQISEDGTLIFGYYYGLPEEAWEWWKSLPEKQAASST